MSSRNPHCRLVPCCGRSEGLIPDVSLARSGLVVASSGLASVPGCSVTPYQTSENPWDVRGPGSRQLQAKLSHGICTLLEGEALKGSSVLAHYKNVSE